MKIKLLDEPTLRHEYDSLLLGDRVIAKKYGVAARTVQRLRAEYGIKPLSRRDRITRRAGVEITARLLRKLYEIEGMTDQEIADKFGVGHTSVVRFRREFGIPTADRFESLVGRRFGRLLIKSETRAQPVIEHCVCDCGKRHDVIRGNLERTGSCGCLAKELRRHAHGEAIRRSVINNDYIGAAARRGLAWGLTWEAAVSLLEGCCHYCGTAPYRTRRAPQSRLYGEYTFNGIDRLDSARGYVPGNVVTSCPACNFAKHRLTPRDFITHARRIHPPKKYVLQEIDRPARQAIYPYCGYKSAASRKGLIFGLTSGQVYAMFESPCVYCDTEGSNNCKGFAYNGIDRVDSAVGYVARNCVPCCWNCNRMKSNWALDEFLGWAARVQAHQDYAVSPSMM